MSILSNHEICCLPSKRFKTPFEAFTGFLFDLPNKRLPYMDFNFVYIDRQTNQRVQHRSGNPQVFYSEISNIDVNDLFSDLLNISIVHTGYNNILLMNFNIKTGEVVLLKAETCYEYSQENMLRGGVPFSMFADVGLGIVYAYNHIIFHANDGEIFLILYWGVDYKFMLKPFQKFAENIFSLNPTIQPLTRKQKVDQWKVFIVKELIQARLGDDVIDKAFEYETFVSNSSFNDCNAETCRQIMMQYGTRAETDKYMKAIENHTNTMLSIQERALKRMEKNS